MGAEPSRNRRAGCSPDRQSGPASNVSVAPDAVSCAPAGRFPHGARVAISEIMRFSLRTSILLVGCAALVWLVSTQGRACFAYWKLRDIDFLSTASPTERRETAHRALRFWLGDPHGAFLVLLHDGDASSIAPLRQALSRHPIEGPVACTWLHARDALLRLEKAKAR